MVFITRSKRGFSLVELLIALGILGMITSIAIGSISLSRAKARDTRRVADMKVIQLGLALYYDVNKVYPTGTDIGALNVLVTQKYLPSIPNDPVGGASVYEYLPYNSNKNYCIGVRLESAIPNDSVSCTSKSSGSTANYKAQR